MRTRLKGAPNVGNRICVSPSIKWWRVTHSDGSNRKGYYKSPIHCFHSPNYTPGYHRCSHAFSSYTNHYHCFVPQQLPPHSKNSLLRATRPVSGSYPKPTYSVHTLSLFLSSNLILFYQSLADLPISLT